MAIVSRTVRGEGAFKILSVGDLFKKFGQSGPAPVAFADDDSVGGCGGDFGGRGFEARGRSTGSFSRPGLRPA